MKLLKTESEIWILNLKVTKIWDLAWIFANWLYKNIMVYYLWNQRLTKAPLLGSQWIWSILNINLKLKHSKIKYKEKVLFKNKDRKTNKTS